MRSFAVTVARELPRAIALGRALRQESVRSSEACAHAIVLESDELLLGAHQHPKRFEREREALLRKEPLHHRLTGGTEAHFDAGSVLWSLALPSVDALYNDASPRTLINRNVRPLLSALTSLGAGAHYLGRQWVSVARRPCVLVGSAMEQDGSVLLEFCARWKSSDQSVGLSEVLPKCGDPSALAATVLEALGASPSERPLEAAIDESEASWPSPVYALPCVIGQFDVGFFDDRLWLGGDLLASRSALDTLARAVQETSLDGRALFALAIGLGVDGARADDWQQLCDAVRAGPDGRE